jgi:exoribonuclease-2
LGRSRLQSEAAAHQALGLSAYLQWTSPIRRYNDLLAHRQWLTHQNLIEAEPLSKELINPLLEKLEQQSREVGQISKEDQRCCLLEWLESLKPKLIAQDGVMLRWLREDQNLALVRIEPWALELPARLRDPAGPGDLLKIHVQEVDPARDLLHLKATIG